MLLKKYPQQKLSYAILTIILANIQATAYADPAWKCKRINQAWNCTAPEITATIATNTSVSDDSTSSSNSTISTSNPSQVNTDISRRNSNLDSNDLDTNIQHNSSGQAVPKQQFTEPDTKKTAKPVSEPPAMTADTQRDQLLLDTEVARSEQQNIQEQTDIDNKMLDWYPYTDGDPNQQGVCKGRYISPIIGNEDINQELPSLQTVFVSADQTDTVLGKSSTLRGNVDLKQGSRSLHSPLAKLNQETGVFSLEEGVTYRQTGLLITGSKAKGNINEEGTQLTNAKYVLHESSVRGDAEVITRKTAQVINIEQGSFTFCPPGDESWKISASEINLDTQSGLGRASHAKLTILGTPVFYFPVLYFPIDDRRQSGFLYPNVKFSSNDSRVSIPYYFNIAPNIDDTLTPTLFTKSGLLIENELRYLNANSLNRISTGFQKKSSESPDDRWAIGANHEGQYGHFTTVIDYTKISDDDYFTDLGTNLDVGSDDDSHLNQTAKVSFQADTWESSLLLQKYQTIDQSTKPYQRLPEFRISGTPNDNLENISFNYRAVFTRFDRDKTGLVGADRVTGDRLILNPSITAEMHKTWGYIKPTATLWNSRYSLNDQVAGTASDQSVTVPILELDSGLYFDRDFSFQGTAYTQTLEPRLYALYVPFKDQSQLPDFDTSELTFTYDSLFRNNRFSGDDRFGDAKQISLGLTSRAISDQGREIISASLGHAFYFNDRKVRIDPESLPLEEDTSDFATAITWRPNTRVRALFDAAFDAGSLNNSEMTFDLKYEEDINHVIGLRHRFTRGTRKQTTFSYLWPMSSNWSTLGLLQYDWRTRETIDIAAGIEYQSCCWKTRLVIRDELLTTLERERSIALQISLKGLGGIGSSPTQELRDKIKGYENREYYNANN
ncbi:MAG: LPS-assembly protein LptD [Oceanospirillaceae bacterium]